MQQPEDFNPVDRPDAAPGDTRMSPAVQVQLLDLNRRFYEQFASAFDQTREPGQPGLVRLVGRLGLQAGQAILDVGCGNGRLARLLDELALPLRYVGVDASDGLLQAARRNTADLQHVRVQLLEIDITKRGWAAPLPAGAFDVVAVLAVLHHLPGRALRLQLLQDLKPLLAVAGAVAISTWQFLNSDRLRGRIVPWEAVGLRPGDVEAGDHLLDWRRGGVGYRYCHLVDEAEMAQLAAGAGLCLRESFHADGRQGDLNLFGLLEACDRARSLPA